MKFFKLRKQYSKSKCFKIITKLRYNNLIFKYNSFIPLNIVVDESTKFPHGINGIFISNKAVIGKNNVIFHQVTIGSNTLKDTKNPGAPVIGDNCYIGAGAKIIGGIKIGNNVRIGANAVVTKDIPDNSTVVIGDIKTIEHESTKDNTFYEINNV